jgi:YhcH/YjgK/YiaL family protein
MIYDLLSNSSSYLTLGPRFALAFGYLEQFQAGAEDGRVPIDGDNVFALIQSYVPAPAKERPFEAHRVHADVQFIAAGKERILYSPLERLVETTPYAASKDVAFYRGEDDFPLLMSPGCFAVLLPGDGHKPGCIWESAEPVRKVVVKIRL